MYLNLEFKAYIDLIVYNFPVIRSGLNATHNFVSWFTSHCKPVAVAYW